MNTVSRGIESLDLRLGPPKRRSRKASSRAPRTPWYTSAEDAWYAHPGLYRVGDAEPITRFAVVSRSGLDEGNFVDATFLAPVQ